MRSDLLAKQGGSNGGKRAVTQPEKIKKRKKKPTGRAKKKFESSTASGGNKEQEESSSGDEYWEGKRVGHPPAIDADIPNQDTNSKEGGTIAILHSGRKKRREGRLHKCRLSGIGQVDGVVEKGRGKRGGLVRPHS